MLCTKFTWLVEFNIYISVPTRNFVVAPSTMAVMLTPNKQWNKKTKRNNIMFKRRGVTVLDQVVNEFMIFFI